MSPPNHHIARTGTGTGTTGVRHQPMKKSSVAQTCNQLSLFLKQKGCLKNLHLGINAKFDDSVKSPAARMTIDLLSNMENPDQNTAEAQKPEDIVNRTASGRSTKSSGSKTAQMTIFYNGKVIVIDDVSADRARDVILAAATDKTDTLNHASGVRELNPPIQAPLQANGLDLPIARRASLHKFLAKRKDRATVKAPYQVHNPSSDAGSSQNGHKFDLNL